MEVVGLSLLSINLLRNLSANSFIVSQCGWKHPHDVLFKKELIMAGKDNSNLNNNLINFLDRSSIGPAKTVSFDSNNVTANRSFIKKQADKLGHQEFSNWVNSSIGKVNLGVEDEEPEDHLLKEIFDVLPDEYMDSITPVCYRSIISRSPIATCISNVGGVNYICIDYAFSSFLMAFVWCALSIDNKLHSKNAIEEVVPILFAQLLHIFGKSELIDPSTPTFPLIHPEDYNYLGVMSDAVNTFLLAHEIGHLIIRNTDEDMEFEGQMTNGKRLSFKKHAPQDAYLEEIFADNIALNITKGVWPFHMIEEINIARMLFSLFRTAAVLAQVGIYDNSAIDDRQNVLLSEISLNSEIRMIYSQYHDLADVTAKVFLNQFIKRFG